MPPAAIFFTGVNDAGGKFATGVNDEMIHEKTRQLIYPFFYQKQ
jgi:hypothetical protein